MINVQEVLRDAPRFERFCSVAELHALVERLRANARFAVSIAGESANGLPIHHLRFGKGSTKAMFVAFPHCMEPIGGLTVSALMMLLHRGHRALLDADVEWHIVPCIDPDGALLNEGWTLQPFTIESFMKNFYLQSPRGQVDNSFPLTHKKLAIDKPSSEAKILQAILDDVQPDFFFSLHNALMGGAFYLLGRDIDHAYHRELYDLLQRERFPLQKRVIWTEFCAPFGEGIAELFSNTKYYDYLEKITPDPEENELVRNGTGSWDYLSRIKPSALSFVAELGYVRHPADDSDKPLSESFRRFKLRLEADNKFLATILLDEWEKVKGDLDPESPFFRAIVGGGTVLPEKGRLVEGGLPIGRYPTRHILFDPYYDKPMTEGDRFKACMRDGGFLFLLFSYQFVRMLKASPQTDPVLRAIQRLEHAYDDALSELRQYVAFEQFEPFDHGAMTKVQLGSGLIVLNSLLEC